MSVAGIKMLLFFLGGFQNGEGLESWDRFEFSNNSASEYLSTM